ncbi:hypothetical protein SCLARK_001351 [Spiroplasma clarkii]|uniref:GmrSD restriction endonuclease domain-containing protein n=1 Tax=Spiroplasma clarkii TaxID=2139 RepID=UPI000B56A259|nr:DUF262 domain-containing protein [Spiroplasma clarkii]ARU91882.1 hypothetical protein SCLARK_001351 [Spiroplasma clarkii]
MYSKNFEFIKNYSNYAWAYEDIGGIERETIYKNKYFVIMESAKLIERLLKQILASQQSKSLDFLINSFKDYCEYEKKHALPSSILTSLKYIQRSRNESAHYSDNGNFEDNSSNTLISLLNFVWHIWKIIHFIIYLFENKDLKIPEFDDKIYYEKSNLTRNIGDEDKFKYESKDITLEKLSIGELVLSENNTFIIPPYQRDYRWEIDECQELINQLIAKFNTFEQVYFGAIACRVEQVVNLKNKILDWLMVNKELQLRCYYLKLWMILLRTKLLKKS